VAFVPFRANTKRGENPSPHCKHPNRFLSLPSLHAQRHAYPLPVSSLHFALTDPGATARPFVQVVSYLNTSPPCACNVHTDFFLPSSSMGISVSQKLGDRQNRCPRALRDGQARASMHATAAKSPNPADPSLTYTHDIVDGPFAVIKSGPGFFTILAYPRDVQGLQVTGPCDADASEPDNLHLFDHLVFCFSWRKNNSASGDPCHSIFPASTDLSHLTTTSIAGPDLLAIPRPQ
jgi:hypothetical protein